MNITQKIVRNFRVIITAVATVAGVVLMPMLAFAQNNPLSNGTGSTLAQTTDLNGLVSKAIGLFNSAIYLIVALAILTFVWNVYQYFIVNDPENRKDAGKYVMYSIIGIFVILSFWGLVNIISNTLNLNTSPGTLNVSNLIGNITGGSSGTLNSLGGSSVNFLPTTSGSVDNNSLYNTNTNTNFNNGSIGNSNFVTSQNQNGLAGDTIVQNSNGTYFDQTSYNNCMSQGGGTAAMCQYSATYQQNPLTSGQSSVTSDSNIQNCISQGYGEINCVNQYGSASNPSSYQQCLASGGDSTDCADAYSSASGNGSTASGQTANAPTSTFGQMQLSNGCIDSSGNPGPNAGTSNCNGLQNAVNTQNCITAGGSSADCTSAYGAGGESALPTDSDCEQYGDCSSIVGSPDSNNQSSPEENYSIDQGSDDSNSSVDQSSSGQDSSPSDDGSSECSIDGGC